MADKDKDHCDPLLISVSKFADRVGETEQVINKLLPEVLKKQAEMIDKMYEHINYMGMSEEVEMDSDDIFDDDISSEEVSMAHPPLTNNFLSLLKDVPSSGNYN